MDFDVCRLLPETFKEDSRTLFLIRGLPGSGKSTLAEIIANAFCTEDWFEADMYFEAPDGYKFNPQQLGDAHDWCFNQFAVACNSGSHCVIVSNTFTRLEEFITYIKYAESKGYKVQVIHCEGSFENTHNVPEQTMQRMRARWERYYG